MQPSSFLVTISIVTSDIVSLDGSTKITLFLCETFYLHCLHLFDVRAAILHERWLGSVAGRRQMYHLLINSLYGSNTYPVLFWAAKLPCEFD